MIARRPSVLFQRQERRNFRAVEKTKKYNKFVRLSARKLGFIFFSTTLPLRVKNHCLVSGESRGVYSTFKLSRHAIKKYFSSLYGLRNSSW